MSLTDPIVGSVAESALKIHSEKWKKIAFSTARVNRERTQEGIYKLYALAKMRPPSHFVWVDSPIQGAIAASLLAKFTGNAFEPSIPVFYKLLEGRLTDLLERRSDRDWWFNIRKQIAETTQSDYGRIPHEVRRAIHAQLSNTRLGVGAASVASLIDAREGDASVLADNSATPEFFNEVLNKLILNLNQQLPWELKQAAIPLTRETQHLSPLLWSAVTALWAAHLGSQDTELPFYDFCAQNGFKFPQIDGPVILAQSCGWWWPLKNICIVSSRPSLVKADESGNLHGARGPAVQYADGWELHGWHGTVVPARFIHFMRNPNAQAISIEPNIEVRRLMLDAFGVEKFMIASGAKKVQQDECGELYIQPWRDDEPIVMVCVINSTPEPDGHFRKYFLRVPPGMRTAREAVAWTFGLTPEEYKPLKET